MLFDTDVLIWVFRGNRKALRAVERQSDRSISAVTYMELLQGARDRNEVNLIKRFMQDAAIMQRPLTEHISHRASIYMEEYTLKAGLKMADALIAATATECGERLCTGNGKHFRAVADLSVKAFRP